MPIVKIEIIQGKSKEYRKAIINGVHKALVHALKITEYDLYQSLYELDADHFEYPPDKTENATVIEIKMFKGRHSEVKKEVFNRSLRISLKNQVLEVRISQ
jgi:phenylpyruvate tautomerase PptA (4-oxalocrotonate tautomerase family)